MVFAGCMLISSCGLLNSIFIFILYLSFSDPAVLLLSHFVLPSVTQMLHVLHPDGASSVSSDEGGVSGVSGSHPGPLIKQQAHHQVSGLANRHPGERPEPGDGESGAQPGPARPLPQGPGVPHHQPTCQGTHLVSES